MTVTGGDSIKADGGIQILDHNGNPLREAAGHFLVSKDNGDGTFAIDFAGVAPGTYVVVITDKWDNKFTSEVIVDQYVATETPTLIVPAEQDSSAGSSDKGNGASDAQIKCVAAGVGTSFLPLLLHAPLTLSSQVRVPGMNQMAGKLNAEIARGLPLKMAPARAIAPGVNDINCSPAGLRPESFCVVAAVKPGRCGRGQGRKGGIGKRLRTK